MMNTVFAAAAVLSLLAVGQSAPLACEKLGKPVEKGQDVITGTWYFIAISTKSWWHSLLTNLFFWPSISYDITAKGPLNTYDWNSKTKMYGYCDNVTKTISYVNNTLLDGTYVGGKGVLLQTDCPDCLVIKDGRDEDLKMLMLLSRRKSVTIAEMAEFTKQAKCNGGSTPQVLNTDHDTENCKTFDPDNSNGFSPLELESIGTSIAQRLRNMFLDWY